MTVAGQPNSIYVIDSLMVDLERIKQANGFGVNVATVDMPSWDFEETGRFYLVSTPALLVWIDQRSGGLAGATHQALKPYLAVTIVGVCKRAKDLQREMWLLAEDVMAVMMRNPQRNHPANPTQENLYGVGTQEDGPTQFGIRQNDQKVTIGIFTSPWRITYQWPIATG